MDGAQVERIHLSQQCRRRRRSGDGHRDLLFDAVGFGMVHQENLDSGSTIVMCYTLFLEKVPDYARFDFAQADMGAAYSGYSPSEAPAVTMKHRQRPEINAATVESCLDDAR